MMRMFPPLDRTCSATVGLISLFAVWVCVTASAGRLFAQSSIDKAWSTLQSGLAEKGDDRVIAVGVLGLVERNPKAAELAAAALSDGKPEVRAAAAEALGRMQAKSAAPKLEEIIETDKEVSVVIAAARALIDLGDPSGYGVYYAVLTGERKSGGGLLDEQKKMLKDSKKMAQFGFEQGIGFVPFAGVGMGAFKQLTKDDTSPVRAAAARMLANDSDPKSGEALVQASSDKSWIVRAAALDALSLRGDPSVIPKIESKLGDDKDTVRYTAAAAIVHLYDVQSTSAKNKSKQAPASKSGKKRSK